MPVTAKVKLQDSKRAFYAGEQVTGKVTLKDPLRSSFSVKGLTIRFYGITSTFQVQGPYSQLREEDIIMDESLVLIPSDTPTKISKTNNSFQFAFEVPQHPRPTVYVNRNNHIRYLLSVTAESPKIATEKEVVISTRRENMEERTETVEVFGAVPADPRDVVIKYGDGVYPRIPAISSDDVKREDFSESFMEGPQIIDISDAKQTTYAPGKNMIFKTRHWGHDAIYSNKVFMDVTFPDPGLWTDEPLNLNVKFYVNGDLPKLCLRSLKVLLTERTFISAKEIGNNEGKHYTLFLLEGPIDLSNSPVHDYSDLIREKAKLPRGLAPDFEGKTMSRHYALSVHLQFYKGEVADDHRVGRQVISARRDLQIFGERNSSVLPSYSYLK